MLKDNAIAMEEIRFGGLTVPSTEQGKTPSFKKKDGLNNEFDIIEQAFIQLTSSEEGKKQYGDPDKGATLEQIWRVSGAISGKNPVCLLATGKPDVPVSEIEKLVRVNPKQMVDALKEIFGLSNNVGIQILYYDGKTGHSISLQSFDNSTSRFIYHDPWPDFSLLSKEYNVANIDAQRVNGQIWSITDEELQRVVFAALVPKNFWAAFSGEKFTKSFDELQQSDFWDYFHIRITAEQKDMDGTTYQLKTGGFQSEISLYVKINMAGELKESNLEINRGWLFGPPYGINPFALDVIKSFLGATVSPFDILRTNYVRALFDMELIKDYAQKFNNNLDEHSLYSDILKVYFGLTESFYIPFDYSDLLFKNVVLDDTQLLIIKMNIDTIG